MRQIESGTWDIASAKVTYPKYLGHSSGGEKQKLNNMDSSAIKYSRQSAVYGGAGSVQQLKDSRILIFGLGPVGVETGKK